MKRNYASPTADAILKIVERNGPVSSKSISEAVGIKRNTLSEALGRLRRVSPKRISIVEWQKPKGKGRWAPLYAIGDTEDVPEPAPRGSKARNEEYRERRRYEIRVRTQARRERPIVAATWMSVLL